MSVASADFAAARSSRDAAATETCKSARTTRASASPARRNESLVANARDAAMTATWTRGSFVSAHFAAATTSAVRRAASFAREVRFPSDDPETSNASPRDPGSPGGGSSLAASAAAAASALTRDWDMSGDHVWVVPASAPRATSSRAAPSAGSHTAALPEAHASVSARVAARASSGAATPGSATASRNARHASFSGLVLLKVHGASRSTRSTAGFTAARSAASAPASAPRASFGDDIGGDRGRGAPAGPDPRGQTPGPELSRENDRPDARDESRRLTPRYALATRQIRLPRVAT